MVSFLKNGNNRQGQSTIEYILLVAAIIAIVIAFTVNNDTGLRKRLNTTLDEVTNKIGDKETTLSTGVVSADDPNVQMQTDLIFETGKMPNTVVDINQPKKGYGN